MSHLQAQKAVCCEICSTKVNVNWFCMRCDEYLCEICNSLHKRTKQTRNCTVIPRDLIEIKIESDKMYSERNCPNHNSENIKFVCRTCNNIEGCLQCVLEYHVTPGKHSVELIGNTTKDKAKDRYQIERLESILESKLRHCAERYSETSKKNEQSQFLKEELVSAIQARSEVLEQELKKAKQKMLQRVEKLFSDSQTHLEHHREQCSEFRRALDDSKEQLKKKQESTSQTDLQSFTQQAIDMFKKTVLPEIPGHSFSFALVAKGTVDDIFGSLTNEIAKVQTSVRDAKEKLYNVEVLGTIHTQNARGIGKICPVSDQMAWIAHSNKNSVEKINKTGKTVRVLKTPFPVQDIAVNSDKDMVLTANSTVWSKDLLNEQSDFRDIKNFEPFSVKGVALVTGQDILVCAQLKGDPGKVVRLSWKGEILMEIHDVTEDPVLCDPYRIAHNIFNDDIAIACRDNILVYTKAGNLRSKWNGLRSDFNPHGITYDNHGNVLMSCYKHNLVYMLDEDGQDGEDGHILLDRQKHTMVTNPWVVAVDVSGKLWLAGNQGVIHIIKYITNYQ
ncbi:uncharacterized protein LOC110448053 [Mizuhopecten yessoensis]|uniref:Transcription intermediary factor 1-alpha n=1 Tax=Mizuhopecten yessoensis TaxID=6573 RepID=A0A210QU04_MIZYE|nr:uncharacterized protein LOC110448053 [Mizuhopecten yessoensis]OWF52197.1 Transcription intermediary factor 1-alpha [Mizuhopecten yessoensis]